VVHQASLPRLLATSSPSRSTARAFTARPVRATAQRRLLANDAAAPASRGVSAAPYPPRASDTPLERHLRGLVRFRGGPLSVADFMAEVLTHPSLGYYMTRDVFGTLGDFVTSPEVSQIFGELLAVWLASLWHQMGRPAKVRLVELGPGRGTLQADLLRAASQLQGGLSAALELHLVEVSPALRRMQAEKLGCGASAGLVGEGCSSAAFGGVQVRWHGSLDTVPEGCPIVVLAHEFFDALPVHQFAKTARGWCERLVDENSASEEEVEQPSAPSASSTSSTHAPLRFVLSPGPTPASSLLVPRRLAALPPGAADACLALEISPRSMAVWEDVARRVAKDGGGALAIDYGAEGPLNHTLQAIRRHAFVDLLDQVGSADLSAHVDFGALRLAAQPQGVRSYGPVSQRQLLGALGISARLQALARGKSDAEVDALVAGAERLVGEQDGPGGEGCTQPGMGLRYQCLAMVHRDLSAPVGFEEAEDSSQS